MTAAVSTAAMAAVEVRGVRMHFGALAALSDVHLRVQTGERRAVIGPNGAGKTTLFHIISGEIEPTAGTVSLLGRDVTGLPPHARARLGMGRTFQRNNLFMRLTVWENVRLAVQVRRGLGAQWLRPVDDYGDVSDEARARLEQVGLIERQSDIVAEISYGEQRQLELALALATTPRVLLLDEPTAGMSPLETTQMVDLLSRLPRDLTVCIIEHDMDVVAALADNITVMHYGQVIADGPAASVRADARVQAVYLGTVAGEGRWSGTDADD